MKDELVKVAKLCQFIGKELPRTYVNMQPDPNGSLYLKIDTRVTRSVGQILCELMANANKLTDMPNIKSLIKDTHRLYQAGEFEDQYDNIARIAPQLKESLIYRAFSHIGASKEEKNFGDALKRVWYEKDTSYHGMALNIDRDPDAAHSRDKVRKAILLTKATLPWPRTRRPGIKRRMASHRRSRNTW